MIYKKINELSDKDNRKLEQIIIFITNLFNSLDIPIMIPYYYIMSSTTSDIKITWNYIDDPDTPFIAHYELSKEQLNNICKYFCVGGWINEYNYYHNNMTVKSHMSSQYKDIVYYTKKWVNYITFQNSRIILQFNLNKCNILRKKKIIRLIED